MKAILLFFALFFLFIVTGAQTQDYITNKDFQAEKKKLNEGIFAAKKTGLEAKKSIAKQDQIIDSLTGVIKLYQVQLANNNDSISTLTLKVNDLQNQVHQKKTSLRTNLIIIFAVILLLLILAFILLFMIKKKADRNFLNLSEAGEKTNSRIDQGLNKVEEAIKANKELIKASSDDLNQHLKTGLGQFETKAGLMEQQIKDNTLVFEDKINKFKEGNELLMKKHEEKLNTFQSLIENKNQELISLINSLEKNQKSIEPGFIERVNALKTQLEQKIQSISAEISKLRK